MEPEATEKGIVLLVDDNPTNLGLLFESLSDSGFKLLAAQDGESAIAQIAHLKPDIILLDVMMPGIDGFETCRLLKQDPETQDIPIIFMTALTDTVDKVRGFSIGAVDYVTKPIQPEEVLARINTHLSIQRLQQQLQVQNQQLQQEICDRQQAEQSLRILLHAVSHDLRNPVTGTLMVLKNLLSSPSNGNPSGDAALAIPVPRNILERMVQSGDRQLNLINSLLEAHTSEVQGIQLHRESVELGSMITAIAQDLQPLLARNQAVLTYNLPPDLPSIEADSTQLWRVFENLISNALKHNPPGIQIAIEAEVQGEGLCVRVRDNGMGIPADQCVHLFDLYTRGSNARHTQGLGLGLFLCRQIIAAHGGQIGIQSDLGLGATFWFTLPLRVAPTAEPPDLAVTVS